MTGTCRRCLLAVALVVAPTLVAAELPSDAREAYAAGIQALEIRQWTVAAGHLARAVRLNPCASAARVRLYGTRFQPYLPHDYLAVALAELGDCAGAAAAAAEADRQAAELLPSSIASSRPQRPPCAPSADSAATEPTPPGRCTPAPPDPGEPLDPVVADVVRLLAAGVASEAVVAWVETSAGRPGQVGVADMVALQRAGASVAVIRAVLARSAAGTRPPA